MQRVPEPELMDDPVQARAYANADFSEPHDAFVQQFAAVYPGGDIRDTILDLGCGPADISVRVASRYPGCRIDGIDGSEAMLREGRLRLQREQLTDRVHLYRCKIPDDPPPLKSYPVVMSNSLLHHLHRPEGLWEYVSDCTAAAGWIFLMDLIRPASKAEAEQLVNTYSGGEPEILKRDFYHSLCAAFTPDEIRVQLQQAGLEHLHVEQVSDRHLIIYGNPTDRTKNVQ